jgi:DNA helicase-2/ATP-dependent DNA helicase PcrA
MSRATPEQARILANAPNARIQIINAAPGSGKTWLVGQIVRRELDAWSGLGGLAALSFTNVAGDEIRRAVGSEPPHPHFVGTIDSFAYRYVFHPFCEILGPQFRKIRLVPGDLASRLGGSRHSVPLTVTIGTSRRINLFDVHIRRMVDNVLMMTYRHPQSGQMADVPPEAVKDVWSHKRKLWCNIGLASHSDLAWLANRIVRHREHGASVRHLLARRFPVIIVDELQDTGWCVGDMLRALLEEPSVRGVLVGDPDQAIYEFGGATPDDIKLFADLPGASVFPMRASRRCPSAICGIANQLTSQDEPVHPASGDPGNAWLIVYDDEPDVLAAARVTAGHSRNILVRNGNTIKRLRGLTLEDQFPEFNSRPLKHMLAGVVSYTVGDMRTARNAASAALALAISGTEALTQAELEQLGLQPREWNSLAISALLKATFHVRELDAYSWAVRTKALLESDYVEQAAKLGREIKVKAPIRNTKGRSLAPLLEARGNVHEGVPIRTVHAAKGETHDVTLLYVPKVLSNRCPANTWWSGKTSEERRVAFVAVTRSRSTFILCVHRNTYERLAKTVPDFVAAFEVHELEAWLTYRQSSAP